MKVLVFEDEKLAAARIVKLLNKYDSNIEILSVIDSVIGGINWLENREVTDLIIMDIHLADGSCFEIFEYKKINVPVIFTTAYDEYSIQAFKVNSVDYLLKPIKEKDFFLAIDKYKSLFVNNKSIVIEDLQKKIESLYKNESFSYRERFLIQSGMEYKIITIGQISNFHIRERNIFLQDNKGKLHGLDFTLDRIEKMLDPESFFRVNRSFIININSIERIMTYSKKRIKVFLANVDDEIIVSRERVKNFKLWIDK